MDMLALFLCAFSYLIALLHSVVGQLDRTPLRFRPFTERLGMLLQEQRAVRLLATPLTVRKTVLCWHRGLVLALSI